MSFAIQWMVVCLFFLSSFTVRASSEDGCGFGGSKPNDLDFRLAPQAAERRVPDNTTPAAASSSQIPNPEILIPTRSPELEEAEIVILRNAGDANPGATRPLTLEEDQEQETASDQLAVIASVLHDLRNAIFIMVNILDFEAVPPGQTGEARLPGLGAREEVLIRTVLNRADPRIIEILEKTILPSVALIEGEDLEAKTRRLQTFAGLIENWFGLIRNARVPPLDVFSEELVDLERLINDFLLFQGRREIFTLNPVATDLRAFIQSFSHIPFPHRQAGVQFHAILGPQVPNLVVIDDTRLRQVLTNILVNAFKFTRVGSVTLRVELSADGRFLNFTIIDTGRGIAPDDLPKIFATFVQCDPSQTRRGLGLGLTIVKRLIAASGGELRVRSRLGRGTKFYFSVPLSKG